MLMRQPSTSLRVLFAQYSREHIFVAPESASVPPSDGNKQPSNKHNWFSRLYSSVHAQFILLQQWFIESTKNFSEPLGERRVLLIIIDALILIAAAKLAYQWSGPESLTLNFFNLAPLWNTSVVILMIWWLLSALNDLYDVPSSAHTRITGERLLVIGVLGCLLYVLLAGLAMQGLPSVEFVLYFAATGLPVIWLWRLICTMLIKRWAANHRVLIIGLGRPGQVIADLLKKAKHLNYQIVGYTSDTELEGELADALLEGAAAPMVLGVLSDLPRLIHEHQVNEVVVATRGDISSDLFDQLIACQGQGVKISWMPDLYEKLCYGVPVEYIDPQWALFAVQGQPIFGRLQLMLKRLLDLVIILFFLPVFFWLLPILALLIRLDSPGPIFYRQVRVGRGGKQFSIWKFRTMVTDAEKDGKARWAMQNDDRITRVGRLLRKARLDELPQILNILSGEMSLVGPRPERPEFVEILQKEIPFYHTRLTVKPGLTGWAQVSYDYGNSTADALLKLHYDFYYIRYWSLWLDLYIIFKTIGIVFRLKGL